MSARLSTLLAALGVVLAGVLILATTVPLGVPGEWTWLRQPVIEPLGIVAVLIVGAAYVGYVHACRESTPVAARLGGLVAIGFVWLLAVQSLPAIPYGLSKSSHVLYLPRSSGYFHEARFGGWTTAEFLAGYEDRMAEGDVLHVGTHPPGLFLLNRVVLNAYEAAPGLASFVASTRPLGVSRVDTELLPARPGEPPLRTADVATLWTVTLLTHVVTLLTCVPLYLLVRRTAGERAAWFAASLWPLVPALGVFLPKSDALLPCVGMLLVWLWVEAVSRGSWRFAALAAAIGWCGLWISLGLLPIGLLAVVIATSETAVAAHEDRWQRMGVAVGVAVGVVAALVIATWWLADLNLLAVWSWNLHNHGGFYDAYPRTYLAWLLANPLELVLAVGLPLALLAGLGVARAMRATDDPRPRITAISILAVWGLLWLSGKNMGEAARLWLVLMPCLPWLAFAATDDDSQVPALLALQCLACAITVAGVNGFALPG